jgi:hypothetical protein
MSHLQKNEINLAEKFTAEYVSEAIRLMAKHHGFTVEEGKDSVTAMDGKSTKTELVLKHIQDKYAIGLNFSNGKLEMVGEFFNNQHTKKKVDEWIKAYYGAVVHGHAFIDSGEYNQISYSFDEKSKEVVVEGELV